MSGEAGAGDSFATSWKRSVYLGPKAAYQSRTFLHVRLGPARLKSQAYRGIGHLASSASPNAGTQWNKDSILAALNQLTGTKWTIGREGWSPCE